MQWGVLAALVAFLTGLIPSSKPVDPEAYCPMGGLQALATYLASDDASYVSGECIRCGGAYHT